MTEIQLLNKIRPAEKSGTVTLKIIILWVFGVITAFLFGWFLKDFFSSNNSSSLLISVIFAVVFLAIFLLQSFFVSEKGASAFIIFLESIAITLPFIGKSLVILSFSLAIFSILYIANSRGRNEIENSLKINFWGVSKAILPKSIIAVSLLFGALTPLYLSSSGEKGLPISPFLFKEIISSGNFLFNKFFPGFTTFSTIEEIATKTAITKLNQVPDARLLSDSVKQQFIQQVISDFYQAISSYASFKVDPKLTVSDAFYEFAKEKFLKLSDQQKITVYAIFGILLFFSIEAVSWPIRIIISATAFIVFEILLALGFAQIVFEEKSKEIIIT